MKKILFFFSFLACFITKDVFAQPALNSIPISIGRDNCGAINYAGGLFASGDFRSGGSWKEATQAGDSVYFFKYAAAALSKSTTLSSMLPRLRVGNTTYTGKINGGATKNYSDRFTVFDASISFNPRDGMVYYIWTDYGLNAAPTLKSYVWRFKPDTTFATGALIPYNTGIAPGIAAPAIALLDTFKSFAFDIGGVTFDNNGTTWQLEFSSGPAPFKSRLRKMNFATGFIDPVPDTLVLQPTTGRGSTMYSVGSGDITLLPNGQMYYVFDNKLYTPDYGSYGGVPKKINSYYIDTIRRPTGSTNLVGLAFGDGDLISAYSPGCIYRRIDPITGDTNYVNYTYLANKGVASSDMTQLASGIGVSKKLVSIAPTGTAKQYDVVYDVFVKNYGTTLLTNIQVKDSLGGINGNGNVSNVTTTMMTIPPPPGIALNGAFNGVANTNLLQSTGQNLPNYPIDSSSFTIRISCRMNNIDTGVVYYNSAVGFATGYKGVPLRDSSTNGPTPDLNQNDKPDDIGESVPTPFLIALTGTRGGCGTLTATLYNENFGPGVASLSTTLPGSFVTTYAGSTTEPIARNTYTFTNNAKNADTTNFISMVDHTTGTGNMMVFNADAQPRVFFRDTMPTSCPGRQYSLTFWTAFPANSVYTTACTGLGGFKYPRVKMRMIDIATGLDVVTLTTDSFYSPGWVQKGMRWTMPRGYSNLIMELSNAAPGGCGNDMVLDDIVYGTCDALPTVNASSLSGCLGDSIRFVGSLSDSTVLPGPKDNQWQVASAAAGPWADIAGATLPYLVINPILPSDTGKFYRLNVAAQGSIGIPICRSSSPGVKLNGQKPSTAPTSITASSPTICSGASTTLTAVGGTLGSSANYQWGTGSTIGTSPISGATGSTLTVSPTSTTTYWVRIENTSSPCASLTGGTTLVVNVTQPSVAPTSITGANICNGASTTLTAVGGTLGTSANYQWGTGSTPGSNPIAGATSSTYTVSPTVTTTYWVKIKNTTSPCADSTAGVTKIITVSQPSAAPTSITGADICNGASTTLTAVGGTLGTSANYQWGTGSTPGSNPIAGATSSTYTVSPTVTTTYWVKIKNTTSPCADSTAGVTKIITVSQPSAAPTSITGANICNGASTTLTAVGGTLGTSANYQWGTGSTPGSNPIAGATSSTYTVSPTVTTTYWVKIKNTTSPCADSTAGVTKIITVSQPSVAPTSITGADICNGASTTLTAVGGTLGTSANYQWGTGSTPGSNPIAGATSSTYTVSPTVTTTYWVKIKNTTSPCADSTAGVTKIITVSQPSVAPTSITGADICNGASTTLTAVGGTLGTSANYQWGTGSTPGSNPIAGATSSTYTVSPTVTTTYWVKIKNTTSPCADSTAGVTKIITVSQPSLAPSGITGANICNPGSTTLTATGGTLGTSANYQWGTGSTVGTSPIVGATGATLTVSPTTTTTYWVRIENTSSPCTATTSGLTKVITVSQPSLAPTSITGANICNGASTTLTAVGGTLGSSANYQWGTGSAIGVSPIVGATGSTLTVSPTTTTTYWVRIENTLSPCTATTSGLTKIITVDQPSVAATSAGKSKNSICPGVSVKVYHTGGTLGTGASWKWYTGSCSGTLVGTGDTLNLTPSTTTTYYVRAEGSCNTTACQQVTVFINCDIDKDDDGIPDLVESNLPAALQDANGNGIINAYDVLTTPFVDTNGDFINDYYQADGDVNNDGILNYLDPTFPGRIDLSGPLGVPDGVDDRFDMDLDGIINMLDLDSDNDGIPDVVEAWGVDVNGDGKIDNYTDTDGDGLSDNVDTRINLVNGAYNTGVGLGRIDFDGDGVPNYLDLDSDNDGIPDVIEVGGPDTNNNGFIDGFTDVNGDGLHDSYINATALLKTGADAGSDGRADSYPNKNFDGDFRPNAYDRDSDGDGIVDVQESGLPDSDMDGIVNAPFGANGWSTAVSSLAALNLRDTDGDGKYDHLDIDSDNDGITDNIEGQTTNGYILPNFTDTDGDGLVNAYDNINGFGGPGILVFDLDGDNTPDYLDYDTDADGQIDRIEGNDFNFNGFADDLVTLTGIDTDGDGLDDRFDNDNTSPKVTSAYMGAGGSLSGPASPGTISVVQKKTPTQSDRDWRYVGSVLPVKFLQFTGLPQGNNVLLNWLIITEKNIDHFEIERSTNNTNYTKVGIVNKPVQLNVQQGFNYTDDITNVNSDIIYYRLKVVGASGEIRYSNVLVVRKSVTKATISIMPNPAKEYVSVRLYSDKDADVMLRLIDAAGKTVLIQKQKAFKGNNTLQINDLYKFSSGTYMLQITLNNETTTQKLIIMN